MNFWFVRLFAWWPLVIGAVGWWLVERNPASAWLIFSVHSLLLLLAIVVWRAQQPPVITWTWQRLAVGLALPVLSIWLALTSNGWVGFVLPLAAVSFAVAGGELVPAWHQKRGWLLLWLALALPVSLLLWLLLPEGELLRWLALLAGSGLAVYLWSALARQPWAFADTPNPGFRFAGLLAQGVMLYLATAGVYQLLEYLTFAWWVFPLAGLGIAAWYAADRWLRQLPELWRRRWWLSGSAFLLELWLLLAWFPWPAWTRAALATVALLLVSELLAKAQRGNWSWRSVRWYLWISFGLCAVLLLTARWR